VSNPFSDQQRAAIHRLRVIDGSIVLRHGIDALVLVHAVLLSGRSVVDASQQLGGGKASYWRMAFRLALNEIAALVGLATEAQAPTRAEALRLAGGGDGRDGA
jgi:hypothetical protein